MQIYFYVFNETPQEQRFLQLKNSLKIIISFHQFFKFQPFQPCHCQQFQKGQPLDPVEKDITPKDQSLWSNLLQLFQKSDEKDDDRTKELSDVPRFQDINFSHNFNPENTSSWNEIKTSLSTLPPRVKQIRGRRKFAKQLDVDNNLSWSNAGEACSLLVGY